MQPAGVHRAAAVPSAGPSSILARLVFGLTLWTFGLPGAVLLAGLLFVAPDAASAWAWVFAGFWMLVAAAGRAFELAVGETR